MIPAATQRATTPCPIKEPFLDELEHVAACRDHRLVAPAFHLIGEAAEVGHQDDGLDLTQFAAPDGAPEHRPGRSGAEVGGEQAGTRAAHGHRLQRRWQRLAQRLEPGEVIVAEAARAVAHDGESLHRAVAIFERHGQVVTATRRCHLVEDRVILLRIELDQTPAEASAVLDDVLERAAKVGACAEGVPRDDVFLIARAIAGPDHAPGAEQRVGEPLAGAQPPDRNPGREQTTTKTLDQRKRLADQPPFADQPFGDRIHRHRPRRVQSRWVTWPRADSGRAAGGGCAGR